MIKLIDLLKEEIRDYEAYRDESALQTVIDGKRNLGWMVLKSSTIPEDIFWNTIRKHKLETLKVNGNPSEAYIYFRKGAESEANKLKDIAEKYGGYLAWDATEEDSRQIGKLLGYTQEDIDKYIEHNKQYQK
jgi:hypothetical protein